MEKENVGIPKLKGKATMPFKEFVKKKVAENPSFKDVPISEQMKVYDEECYTEVPGTTAKTSNPQGILSYASLFYFIGIVSLVLSIIYAFVQIGKTVLNPSLVNLTGVFMIFFSFAFALGWLGAAKALRVLAEIHSKVNT